jgi:hypothetical protein
MKRILTYLLLLCCLSGVSQTYNYRVFDNCSSLVISDTSRHYSNTYLKYNLSVSYVPTLLKIVNGTVSGSQIIASWTPSNISYLAPTMDSAYSLLYNMLSKSCIQCAGATVGPTGATGSTGPAGSGDSYWTGPTVATGYVTQMDTTKPVSIGKATPAATLDVKGTFSATDSNGMRLYTGYQYVTFEDSVYGFPSTKCQYVEPNSGYIYTAGVEKIPSFIGGTAQALLAAVNPSLNFEGYVARADSNHFEVSSVDATGVDLSDFYLSRSIMRLGSNGQGVPIVLQNNIGDGNVGIGTDTPNAKLEVHGTFRLSYGIPAPGYILAAKDNNGEASWETVGNALQFYFGSGYANDAAAAAAGIAIGQFYYNTTVNAIVKRLV